MGATQRLPLRRPGSYDEFPVLSTMAAEMGASMGGEEQFEFGLDVLLAGLAATVSRRNG